MFGGSDLTGFYCAPIDPMPWPDQTENHENHDLLPNLSQSSSRCPAARDAVPQSDPKYMYLSIYNGSKTPVLEIDSFNMSGHPVSAVNASYLAT